MNKLRRTLLIAPLVGLTLAFGTADAASLSEAVDQARRETGGRVLSARTEVRGNSEIHVIKVLTQDGRVRVLRYPGERRRSRNEQNLEQARPR